MNKLNIRDYIPKDKFDNSNIEILYNLTDEEIKPIIYDLLEWLQDFNWPVANEILGVLMKREDLVFPYIKDILSNDDVMWKIHLMDLLIPSFTDEHKKELENQLVALSNIQEEDEDSIAIKESAQRCLNKCFDILNS